MANKSRGEVTLQAGDVTYTIRFTVNKLCNLEDALQMPITKIGAELGDVNNVKLGLLRVLLKYGLVEEKTIDEAGDIIGEAGLPNVMLAISEALLHAFPTVEAKGAEQNPK